ncbi:hypothetical protein NADFUDRAFT_49464 [Nadsonia fulvescens var. elongata DSM 6958]|uniref:Uncharacterized protein n=1 Tax=Nadsonia fulvescens var. elongata DSM 6958 TaxID=857566 RepID=A0A1E3PQ26_9ASCO|nr:hypothetical protein NADFUDRAFT_49464 [Nadsonia fulvescens var. elongata DSM 6958]
MAALDPSNKPFYHSKLIDEHDNVFDITSQPAKPPTGSHSENIDSKPKVTIPRSKSARTGGGFFLQSTRKINNVTRETRSSSGDYKREPLSSSKISSLEKKQHYSEGSVSLPQSRVPSQSLPVSSSSKLSGPDNNTKVHSRSNSDQFHTHRIDSKVLNLTQRDPETKKDIKLLTSLILKLKQVQDHEIRGDPGLIDHRSIKKAMIENEPLSPISPTANIFSFQPVEDTDGTPDAGNDLNDTLNDNTYNNIQDAEIASLRRHNISPMTWNRAVKTRAFFELYYHSLSRHQIPPPDYNHNNHGNNIEIMGVYNPLQIIRNRKIRSRQSFHFVEPIEIDPSLNASSLFSSKRNRKLIWEIPVFELLGDISWRSGNRRLMKNRKGEYIYKESGDTDPSFNNQKGVDANSKRAKRAKRVSSGVSGSESRMVSPPGITSVSSVISDSPPEAISSVIEPSKSAINGSVRRSASSAQLSLLGKSSSETDNNKERAKTILSDPTNSLPVSDSSDIDDFYHHQLANYHQHMYPYKIGLLSKLTNPQISASEPELHTTSLAGNTGSPGRKPLALQRSSPLHSGPESMLHSYSTSELTSTSASHHIVPTTPTPAPQTRKLLQRKQRNTPIVTSCIQGIRSNTDRLKTATVSRRQINRLVNELEYCETVLKLSWMHFFRRSQHDYRSELASTTQEVSEKLQELSKYVASVAIADDCSTDSNFNNVEAHLSTAHLKLIKTELEYQKSAMLDSALFTSDRVVTEISTSLNLEAKRVCESLDRLECRYISNFSFATSGSSIYPQGQIGSGRWKFMYCMLDWFLRLSIWSIWGVVQILKLGRLFLRVVADICKWFLGA